MPKIIIYKHILCVERGSEKINPPAKVIKKERYNIRCFLITFKYSFLQFAGKKCGRINFILYFLSSAELLVLSSMVKIWLKDEWWDEHMMRNIWFS